MTKIYLTRHGTNESFHIFGYSTTVTVGSGADCALQVTGRHVAEHHCRLLKLPPHGTVVVANSESSLTYINGVLLDEDGALCELPPNGLLSLGVPPDIARNAPHKYLLLKLVRRDDDDASDPESSSHSKCFVKQDQKVSNGAIADLSAAQPQHDSTSVVTLPASTHQHPTLSVFSATKTNNDGDIGAKQRHQNSKETKFTNGPARNVSLQQGSKDTNESSTETCSSGDEEDDNGNSSSCSDGTNKGESSEEEGSSSSSGDSESSSHEDDSCGSSDSDGEADSDDEVSKNSINGGRLKETNKGTEAALPLDGGSYALGSRQFVDPCLEASPSTNYNRLAGDHCIDGTLSTPAHHSSDVSGAVTGNNSCGSKHSLVNAGQLTHADTKDDFNLESRGFNKENVSPSPYKRCFSKSPIKRMNLEKSFSCQPSLRCNSAVPSSDPVVPSASIMRILQVLTATTAPDMPASVAPSCKKQSLYQGSRPALQPCYEALDGRRHLAAGSEAAARHGSRVKTSSVVKSNISLVDDVAKHSIFSSQRASFVSTCLSDQLGLPSENVTCSLIKDEVPPSVPDIFVPSSCLHTESFDLNSALSTADQAAASSHLFTDTSHSSSTLVSSSAEYSARTIIKQCSGPSIVDATVSPLEGLAFSGRITEINFPSTLNSVTRTTKVKQEPLQHECDEKNSSILTNQSSLLEADLHHKIEILDSFCHSSHLLSYSAANEAQQTIKVESNSDDVCADFDFVATEPENLYDTFEFESCTRLVRKPVVKEEALASQPISVQECSSPSFVPIVKEETCFSQPSFARGSTSPSHDQIDEEVACIYQPSSAQSSTSPLLEPICTRELQTSLSSFSQGHIANRVAVKVESDYEEPPPFDELPDITLGAVSDSDAHQMDRDVLSSRVVLTSASENTPTSKVKTEKGCVSKESGTYCAPGMELPTSSCSISAGTVNSSLAVKLKKCSVIVSKLPLKYIQNCKQQVVTAVEYEVDKNKLVDLASRNIIDSYQFAIGDASKLKSEGSTIVQTLDDINQKSRTDEVTALDVGAVQNSNVDNSPPRKHIGDLTISNPKFVSHPRKICDGYSSCNEEEVLYDDGGSGTVSSSSKKPIGSADQGDSDPACSFSSRDEDLLVKASYDHECSVDGLDRLLASCKSQSSDVPIRKKYIIMKKIKSFCRKKGNKDSGSGKPKNMPPTKNKQNNRYRPWLRKKRKKARLLTDLSSSSNFIRSGQEKLRVDMSQSEPQLQDKLTERPQVLRDPRLMKRTVASNIISKPASVVHEEQTIDGNGNSHSLIPSVCSRLNQQSGVEALQKDLNEASAVHLSNSNLSETNSNLPSKNSKIRKMSSDKKLNSIHENMVHGSKKNKCFADRVRPRPVTREAEKSSEPTDFVLPQMMNWNFKIPKKEKNGVGVASSLNDGKSAGEDGYKNMFVQNNAPKNTLRTRNLSSKGKAIKADTSIGNVDEFEYGCINGREPSYSDGLRSEFLPCENRENFSSKTRIFCTFDDQKPISCGPGSERVSGDLFMNGTRDNLFDSPIYYSSSPQSPHFRPSNAVQCMVNSIVDSNRPNRVDVVANNPTTVGALKVLLPLPMSAISSNDAQLTRPDLYFSSENVFNPAIQNASTARDDDLRPFRPAFLNNGACDRYRDHHHKEIPSLMSRLSPPFGRGRQNLRDPRCVIPSRKVAQVAPRKRSASECTSNVKKYKLSSNEMQLKNRNDGNLDCNTLFTQTSVNDTANSSHSGQQRTIKVHTDALHEYLIHMNRPAVVQLEAYVAKYLEIGTSGPSYLVPYCSIHQVCNWNFDWLLTYKSSFESSGVWSPPPPTDAWRLIPLSDDTCLPGTQDLFFPDTSLGSQLHLRPEYNFFNTLMYYEVWEKVYWDWRHQEREFKYILVSSVQNICEFYPSNAARCPFLQVTVTSHKATFSLDIQPGDLVRIVSDNSHSFLAYVDRVKKFTNPESRSEDYRISLLFTKDITKAIFPTAMLTVTFLSHILPKLQYYEQLNRATVDDLAKGFAAFLKDQCSQLPTPPSHLYRYSVGDRVCIQVADPAKVEGSKSLYKGPFIILGTRGPFMLVKLNNSVSISTHAVGLRPFSTLCDNYLKNFQLTVG